MDLGIGGRVALVAGASQGIGRAIARSLAAEGAKLALFARTPDKLEEAAKEVNGLAVPVDLADRAATKKALERVKSELGAPAIFVHAAAAVYEPKKLQYTDDDEVDRFLETDLRSAIEICKAVLPDMMQSRWGRVVMLSSLAARNGVSGATLYGVAKAGLEGLVRGIALDDSRRGITANAVALGFVDTERLAMRVSTDPQARERLTKATATKRLPTPAEVADVVTFLCSPRANAITGAVIDVTAGAHLNNLW